MMADADKKNDLHFAMHIYFAEKAIQLCAMMGPVTVWTFGVCTILTVTPAAVGAGVIFVSTAVGLWSYAAALGSRLNWRLNDQVMMPAAGGLVAMLVFVLAAVFFEPRVYEGGLPVSFVALTTIFLTLNMMPNIIVAS